MFLDTFEEETVYLSEILVWYIISVLLTLKLG